MAIVASDKIEEKIVHNASFYAVEEVKLDTKKRVTLGKIVSLSKVTGFKVYRNAAGQLLLDPQVAVSPHEAELLTNPEQLQLLAQGMLDVMKGRTHPAREDYTQYVE